MNPNPQLERIIAQETYSDLLLELRPKELAVVALCIEGITYTAANELLGLKRNTAHERMRRARQRLLALHPHIRSRVGDS